MTNKNLMGKTRPSDNPYMIFTAPGWVWKVRKAYQNPEREAANPAAIWFCEVSSPATYGGSDLGDTYVRDVVSNGRLTYMDPILMEAGYTVPEPVGQHPMDAWL